MNMMEAQTTHAVRAAHLSGEAPIRFTMDTLSSSDIKKLRDNAEERLAMALQYLPSRMAFREAAIACRSLIRDKQKSGNEFGNELSLLYWLAGIESYVSEFSRQSDQHVLDVRTPQELELLPVEYHELGYERLGLLSKTDIKWMVEAWGEPDGHSTLFELRDSKGTAPQKSTPVQTATNGPGSSAQSIAAGTIEDSPAEAASEIPSVDMPQQDVEAATVEPRTEVDIGDDITADRIIDDTPVPQPEPAALPRAAYPVRRRLSSPDTPLGSNIEMLMVFIVIAMFGFLAVRDLYPGLW